METYQHNADIAEQANTLALLVQENNPLLALWCDFYTRLASHVVSSHTTLRTLFSDKDTYRLLPYLKELAPIAPAWQMQKLSPLQSLALLPYEVLWRISTFSALAIHRDLVLKIIKKEDVLALHDLVGKEGWNFVMRKSSLYKAERLALTFCFFDNTPVQCVKNTALSIRNFYMKGIAPALQTQVCTLFPAQMQDNVYESVELDSDLVNLLEQLTMQIIQNEVEPIWKDYLL